MARKKTIEKDGRLGRIQEQLIKFTQLDFNGRMPVSEKGDDIDAIIVGLNTLGEELSAGKHSKETQLINTEEQFLFASLINSTDDAVISKSLDGIVRSWNEGAKKIFGYAPEEVIGKHISMLIPAELLDEEKRIIEKIKKDEPVQHYETLRKKKDGTQAYLSITVSPIKDKNGNIIGASKIARDITEAKKIEAELREKTLYIETRIGEILEILLKYTLLDFSEKISIRDKGDELDAIAVGLNTLSEELISHIEQLKESEEKYRALFDSMDEGYCIIEMIFDEQKRPVDYRFLLINASFERQTGLRNAVGKRMRDFAPNHEEYWFETYGKIALTGESARFENRAEQLHRWYDVYAFRLGDPKNLQVGILFNDITERKKTEEQLKSVNKELESFSYSVSHDLRAPLRAINGFANILREDYTNTLDEEGKRLLGVIQHNAKKMGSLIDDLLAFSRLGRQEIQKTHVNMEELAKDALLEAGKMSRHKAEVRIEPLLSAPADHTLMTQVFVNLISNAIKYSSRVDRPIIEIKSEQKKGEVIYCIKDNGAGFNMQYAHKLFGVFQRLHRQDEFEGTGVGLAIVQRILAKHGGKIWVEAEVGKGAAFYFTLPLN